MADKIFPTQITDGTPTGTARILYDDGVSAKDCAMSELPISDETQTALNLKADKSNVLQLDNTTAFTPNADYEPATKKYVDDNAGGGGHTIQEAGVDLPQRNNLNFSTDFSVTDNSLNNSTDISINATQIPDYTITNTNTDRNLDGSNTTLNEVVDIVGTLATDIENAKFIAGGGMQKSIYDPSNKESEVAFLDGGNTFNGIQNFYSGDTEDFYKIDNFISKKLEHLEITSSFVWLLMPTSQMSSSISGTIYGYRSSGVATSWKIDILISTYSNSVSKGGKIKYEYTYGNTNPSFRLVTCDYGGTNYLAIQQTNTKYQQTGVYFSGICQNYNPSYSFKLLLTSVVTNVVEFTQTGYNVLGTGLKVNGGYLDIFESSGITYLSETNSGLRARTVGNMEFFIDSDNSGTGAGFSVVSRGGVYGGSAFTIGGFSDIPAITNKAALKIGGYYLWVDATGDLRIKSSAPTTDLDGTIVGTQS